MLVPVGGFKPWSRTPGIYIDLVVVQEDGDNRCRFPTSLDVLFTCRVPAYIEWATVQRKSSGVNLKLFSSFAASRKDSDLASQTQGPRGVMCLST